MTALQELIEELTKKGRNTINGSYLNLIGNNLFSIEVRKIFKTYLEKEKQQIIEAYDLGSLEDLQHPDENVIYNGKQYYKETYEK